MKLTSRLNAAVEDLIKMGQKYKKRSEIVSRKIDQDKYSSIRNSNPSTLFDTKNSLAPRPEKGNDVPVIQSATQMENSLTSMTDVHKAIDGGESPNMVEHLARRQKNLTMANQVSIN